MSALHRQVIKEKLISPTLFVKTEFEDVDLNESKTDIDSESVCKLYNENMRMRRFDVKDLESEGNEFVDKMGCEDFNTLWSGYFEKSLKIGPFQVYLTVPKLSETKEGTGMSFFIMHHGAGSCGLSFACLAKEITKITNGACGVLSFDVRGHGISDEVLQNGLLDLRLEELSKDFVKMVELVCQNFGWDDISEIVLVGHSIGGAVLTHVAKNQLLPNILGCAVLDIVEGSAINSFSTMMYHLLKRPKFFSSIREGIDWHLKNKILKNEQSAKVSIPLLFKRQISLNTGKNKWIWRVDLNETEPFWHGWLNGLSDCFLAIPSAKLLILSSKDRLDKTLMIAQMQGKFQLLTFQNTGHFIHEDLPELTAKALVSFWKRNQKSLELSKRI
ncbi:hypothetical protein PNEG_00445 [Pneumocystis murina B123]|uniref:Protein phosphatase methylesterase 1 n=1 Tax=Pneumocystis murina (strain B123) TaxID=1069680 RepID=M7NVU0_PNEMU|nr:hypothetical protein PNEG_00445 [Pneumocystis murina B123]EMR11422.1 hypothetical protein PNEG_00445 [Pneumocystis murina B123]